jgi:hypothetical protein
MGEDRVPRRSNDGEGDEDNFGEDHAFHDDDAETDSELQTEAEVTCPYCGEVMTIVLDAAGGTTQEYVEDCQVCCRPWQVRVSYGEGGAAEVWLEESA